MHSSGEAVFFEERDDLTVGTLREYMGDFSKALSQGVSGDFVERERKNKAEPFGFRFALSLFLNKISCIPHSISHFFIYHGTLHGLDNVFLVPWPPLLSLMKKS